MFYVCVSFSDSVKFDFNIKTSHFIFALTVNVGLYTEQFICINLHIYLGKIFIKDK